MFAFANMMRHLGEGALCEQLRGAVRSCIEDGEKTADIGGSLSTTEFTDAVIARTRGAAGA